MTVVSTDMVGLLVVAEPSEEEDKVVTLPLVSPDTPLDSVVATTVFLRFLLESRLRERERDCVCKRQSASKKL